MVGEKSLVPKCVYFSVIFVLWIHNMDAICIRWKYSFYHFQGGGYLLDLLDDYAAGWPYLFIGFTELIIISHIYGIQNFFDDVYSIVKFNNDGWLNKVIKFIYMFVSPVIIGIILLVSWGTHAPLTKGSYSYPEWADGKYQNTLGQI